MTDPTDPAAATEVCLTRHGETDWNRTGVLQGWIDVPLNEHGRRQSYAMAAGFSECGFRHIWSSPLQRASETADILARALGLPPPVLSDGLKERNFGVIQGMTKQALAEIQPGLHDCILRRDPGCHFEHGESIDAFADRVMTAIQTIGARHPGERVLAITHGWVMDVVTRHVRGLPRGQVLDLKRQNGESLWLVVTPDSVAAERVPQAGCE
jgi:probable phosphoglycerate mutase